MHEGRDLTHEGLVEPRDVTEADLARLGAGLMLEAPSGGVRKRISVAERVSKHRMILIRKATGKPVTQFNATKARSWEAKPKNRAKAKAARKSRKANR